MLRIKEHREAQGLSQEALAYLSGVSWKTVQRAETLRVASSRTLIKVAKGLKVGPGDLFSMPKRNGRKRKSA